MNTVSHDPQFSAAMDFLKFSPEQRAQQADLSARLLQMACIGCPRPAEGSPLTKNLIAMQALLIAYVALASTDPEITELGGSLAFDMAHRLRVVHEERLQADIDVAMAAAFPTLPTH